MIEINLLPEEQRAAKKSAGIDPKLFLFAAPAVLVIFILAHVYVTSRLLVNKFQLTGLEANWKKLEPQRKQLEVLRREYDVSLEDAKMMQDIIGKRINWSEKLNKMSLNLPSGIWFTEISLSSKDLSLKASAVSLQKEEVNLINRYIDNLKKDENFSRDFSGLDLGSVQRKTIGGYDVVDFTLSGKIKEK